MTDTEFIATQVSYFRAKGIKLFPEDFCEHSDVMVVKSPEKNLVLGKNFFGYYEVTTARGEPVFNFDDLNKAKFIVYSSRSGNGNALLPEDDKVTGNAVKKYESFLDGILNEIKKNYLSLNQDSKNFGIVSSEIFMKLNLTRL